MRSRRRKLDRRKKTPPQLGRGRFQQRRQVCSRAPAKAPQRKPPKSHESAAINKPSQNHPRSILQDKRRIDQNREDGPQQKRSSSGEHSPQQQQQAAPAFKRDEETLDFRMKAHAVGGMLTRRSGVVEGFPLTKPDQGVCEESIRWSKATAPPKTTSNSARAPSPSPPPCPFPKTRCSPATGR